jgi:hypothetical protein
MFRILTAALAALVLVSCGGGGGADDMLSSSASTAPLQAKKVSPGPTLLAEQVSVVSTTTIGDQVLRAIGATIDGGYVVAWISGGPTLYIQAYDSAGAKTGAQTQVALEVPAPFPDAARRAIQQSSVAVLNDGSVVVAYLVTRNIELADGTTRPKAGVYFQRFDANGAQLVAETEVVSQEEPPDPRGSFLTPPTTLALSGGVFVVGWAVAHFSEQFGSISTLSLRWFDSQGQAVGSPVEVGDFPQLRYSLVADTHGGFTLSTFQLDNFFNTDVSAFHYDPSHMFQQVAPRFGTLDTLLLLPLQSGYVLFAKGPGDATAQLLDSQANPIGLPTTIPSMPIAARELADGTYVAVWPVGGGVPAQGFAAQRYAADGTPMGELLAIDSNAGVPQIVALADTGFAAAWSAASANGDTDVYTQRFIEASKKACLNSAKGLKGQDRKAFMNACLA